MNADGKPAASQSGAPFFVVGCPRSGTTLLSVLLDRHSRLCVTPETAFFNDIAPALPKLADRGLVDLLSRWRRLPELNIVPSAVLERLSGRAPTADRVLGALLDLYGARQNKARCGEKTPEHLKHVPTILNLFPEARILCLMRNGIDVSLSLTAMPWWGPGNLRAAARLWLNCAELSDRFTNEHPGRFSMVRYEDLVCDPSCTLTTVMAFLGESFEAGQLDPTRQSDVVLARSIAWKGESLQSVHPRPVGLRRATATEQQMKFLRRRLGNALVRNGYP